MKIRKEVVEAAEYIEDVLNRLEYEVECPIVGESSTHVNDVTTNKAKDNKVQLSNKKMLKVQKL